MGGSWIGIVQGFANLHIENGEIKTENLLPEQIKSLKFNIKFQNELKRIVISSK
jgi:alpha,alpha-trehalose phosphorylase